MTGSAGAGAWAAKISDCGWIGATTIACCGCGAAKTRSLDAIDAGAKFSIMTGSLKPSGSSAWWLTPKFDAR